MGSRFSRTRFIAAITLAALLVSFGTGCTRDPNIRKQKYLASGKRYMAKGQYRDAAIQFANALRIDSKFAEAHYNLALCDLKLGSAQNAYRELVRTTILDPDDLQAQLDLGNFLLAGGQIGRAGERADLVLSKDPSNVPAHILKANAQDRSHQLDDALTQMHLAVQLDPGRSDSYLNLGMMEAEKAKDSTASEADFKKAIELDPKSVQARVILAAYYDANKRFADAGQVLDEAVKKFPRDLDIRKAIVLNWQAQGNKAQAEQAAKDARLAMKSDPVGSQFLAQYYLSIHDVNSARTEYASLAKQFPKEVSVQQAYANLLIEGDDSEAAMKQVDALLKLSPKDSQALTDKGMLLVKQGRASEARDLLQGVIKADMQNVVAHFELGNAYQALGDVGEAESEWREALHLNSKVLPAYESLAKVALKKQDWPNLEQIAGEVIRVAPNQPQGFIYRSAALFGRGDIKDGEDDLKHAIAIAPQNPIGYLRLAEFRMATKNYSEAEQLYQHALSLDPASFEAVAGLARAYAFENQNDKALAAVQQFVDKGSNHNGYVLLAALLTSDNKIDAAEQVLEKAVAANKKDIQAYDLLDMLYLRNGAQDKAEKLAEDWKENNPRDVRPYLTIAGFEEAKHNFAAAQADYQAVLAIQPDNGLAANNLAFLMMSNGGSADVALNLAQTARKALPNAPFTADTLGWAYYKKGIYATAQDYLSEAAKGEPKNAVYHYHLALTYDKLGKHSAAAQEAQQCLNINPNLPEATQVRSLMGTAR